MNNKNIFEKNAKIPDIVQQKANAAFTTIYNRQDEPDVKPQKTHISTRAMVIKFAATVLVAAITVAVLFGAIAYFGGKGPEIPGVRNQFTIRVCAAELEPKASLPISLDVSKQAFGYGVDWEGNANFQINFPISVDGENISSVTFKAGNAFIEVVSIDCPSVVKSGSPKTIADFNSTYVEGYDISGHPVGKTEVGYYDSFTADYDTLQNSKYLLNICNVLTDRMDLYYLLNHEGDDDDRCAANTYLVKDVKVTVEVTFKDGTKSSRSLSLFAKPIQATDKTEDGQEYTYFAIQFFCYDKNDADDATKKLISSQITRAKEICKAGESKKASESATTNDDEPVDDTDASESEPAKTDVTESETTEESSKWTFKSSHDVKVEAVAVRSFGKGDSKVSTIVPKISVDGKEATEINDYLSDYIQKKYPLKENGDYADGLYTRLRCGAKDNILSIIILASDTSSDYFTREVINYDLDTLKKLESSDVTKSLGMTDDAFFNKVKDIIKAACKDDAYDLDKSLALVNYDKVTPFILPDGTIGISASLIYSDQTQFTGSECVRCFNMSSMERVF